MMRPVLIVKPFILITLTLVVLSLDTVQAFYISDQNDTITIQNQDIRLIVNKDPVYYRFEDLNGVIVLSQPEPDTVQKNRRPFSFRVGYSWYRLTKVIKYLRIAPDTLLLTCSTSGGRYAYLSIKQLGENVYKFSVKLERASAINRICENFKLDEREHLMGGGQHFNAIDQRGRTFSFWVHHPRGGSEEKSAAYMNDSMEILMPLIISSKGYAIFMDTYARGWASLGDPGVDRDLISWSVQDKEFSYQVILGKNPLDVISKFASVNGKPPLPPKWVFSPHKWRDRYHDSNELYEDVQMMSHLGIPLGSIWLDNPWEGADPESGFVQGDLSFHPRYFPEAKKMIETIHSFGCRFLVWLSPFIRPTSVNYQEALKKGYLVQKVRYREHPHVDFTNPQAREWWKNKVQKLILLGIDGVKLDRGEEDLGDSAIYNSGFPNSYVHNQYPYLYAKATCDAFEELGIDDYLVIPRSGYIGSRTLIKGFWAGDQFSYLRDPQGMKACVRAGQNIGLSGFPFWGSDIGGYEGYTPKLGFMMPSKITFLRWAQFGAFCPIMETGGRGIHEPWDIDQEAIDIYRKYAVIHTELFPYLYSYSLQAHRTGLPIIRALALYYPNHPISYKEQIEYFLGEEILVAPVYSEHHRKAMRAVYLPPGSWYDFFTAERFEGDRYHSRAYALNRMPVFIKAGSTIPYNFRSPNIWDRSQPWGINHLDDDHKLGWLVFPGAEVSKFELYDGSKTRVKTDPGGAIKITYQGLPRKNLCFKVMIGHGAHMVFIDGLLAERYEDEQALSWAAYGWCRYVDDYGAESLIIKTESRGKTRIIILGEE